MISCVTRKFCYGNSNIGAIYRLFCGKKAVKVEYFHERKKKKPLQADDYKMKGALGFDSSIHLPQGTRSKP